MLLAIDIGNTNIVLGLIKEDKILFTSRIKTDKEKTHDQYAIDIKNLIEIYGYNTRDIKDSIISSVVPPVMSDIKQAVYRLTKKEALVVGPGIKTGLNILMDDPGKVGSDLIVDAIAGINEYPLPIIIIDMGTATTLCVVDENKNYIGGCIMPGTNLSLEALSDKTAQLPHIDLNEPKKIMGKNTIDCMKSGAVYGTASMLDGMIERTEAELGKKATRIITGGIAKYIYKHCKNEIIYDDDLLLKGLNCIYKKNNI